MTSMLFFARRMSARHQPRGQVLVIVGIGMLAFLAMVALVVDGGHAWGQQRDAQNGADAAALAGTVEVAENRPAMAAGELPPNSDADVLNAVNASATQNNIIIDSAVYTDFNGDPLVPTIPVGILGPLPPPPTALGVEVTAHKDFGTFLAGVIGFDSLTADVTATARTGPLGMAPANAVLPVTFPVTITGCDGTNKPIQESSGAEWELNVPYIVPLCAGAPGNVGWLDWTPTGGGTSEVVASISTPNNPPLSIPEWHYVTSTGNMSASGLEAAIAQYAVPPTPMEAAPAGTVVLIPLFDDDCQDKPSGTGGNRPCDHGGMTGAQGWYHFNNWVAFEIDWVNLNGGSSVCSQAALIPGATGNGSTGCFKGTFRQYMGPGVLTAPTGTETELTPWGVDLVK